MSDKVKKSLVMQGSILALAGIISKIIGFLYRIPMANIMGNTGNGLYSVAFGIYNIALTLSSYSMPLAVSKLMSERIAKKEYKNAHKLFNKSLLFAFCTGLIAALVLYFGAEFFAGLYQKEGLERPLRVLAPTTFVVALLGTCRGYFQGHKNMLPTAVSQVFEQIVNAVVSVLAAGAFVASCTTQEEIASYGAMGGTFGTLAGAIFALLILVGLFIKQGKVRQEELSGGDLADEENALIFKALLLTVIPVILSQSIYQLGYTLDDYIFGNLMFLKGNDATQTTNLQGVFNTQYNQMINLPTAIASAMASATIPSIVASFTVGNRKRVEEKMSAVLKINMLIAIPSAVGLAVLADPIMAVLFPGLNEYHDTAVLLLQTGSSAVVFYALSTCTTSILQGCNRMRVPVIHSGISLVLHGILVAALLWFTNLGVLALIIGNVTFPLLVCVLNCCKVKKLLDYRFCWMDTFIKPALAAAVMGVLTFGAYTVSRQYTEAAWISLILGILAALPAYAGMLAVLKVFTKEELKALPVIGKRIK